MALIRNIGSIGDTGLSDTDILVNAYNNGNVDVQEAPALAIPVMEVQTTYPVSGGNVDGAPGGTGAANVAEVNAGADNGNSDVDVPLLIAGLGALYLLAGGGKSITGLKKKSLVIPAVIVGGVGLWWYMSKKGTGSAATTATVDKTEQATLTGRYSGQTKQLAAINAADAETIHRWALLVSMWDAQWPASKIYATAPDGTSPATWDNSIGKWWELFSQQNGF